MQEIELIYELYISLQMRSLKQQGIDKDVFVKFIPFAVSIFPH